MKLLLIFNKKDDYKYSNSSLWKKKRTSNFCNWGRVFSSDVGWQMSQMCCFRNRCATNLFVLQMEKHICAIVHNMHWLHILQYDRCRVSSCQCPYFTSGAKSSLEISNSNPFLSNWAPGATKRLQVEQWYINLHINWTGIADICSCSSNHSQGQTLIEILSF